jgi:hypothetical protein
MSTLIAEQRREERFPVTNGAKLKVHCKGDFLRATVIDISRSGVLIQFSGIQRLKPGDFVTCDIDYDDGEGCENNVGKGRVVRIQPPYMAIIYTGELFSRLRP